MMKFACLLFSLFAFSTICRQKSRAFRRVPFLSLSSLFFMELQRNHTVSSSVVGGAMSGLSPELVLSPPYCSNLDHLFLSPQQQQQQQQHNTVQVQVQVEEDVSLDWLSVFVEECLSSTGNCLPRPPPPPPVPSNDLQPQTVTKTSSSSKKARRSKRKRSRWWWSDLYSYEDPPLLEQPIWLADSELIHLQDHIQEEPKKVQNEYDDQSLENDDESPKWRGQQGQGQGPRRCCSHCMAQRTPQWRAGPLGPKTLCNACGVRYKSGRLLPEYRPAKSPSFLNYKHSNSHKKVLQIRTTSLLSPPHHPYS